MSNIIELSDKQKNLIEKLGVANEKSGLQPAAARIMALLLVAPDPELTFDQVRETLNLSKSATSNALNLMMSIRKIDYITKPGDRKRYFRSRVASWKRDISSEFDKFSRLSDLLEEVLESRPGTSVEFNQNLADVIDFMRYMHEEIPQIYKRWEESRR